MKTSVRLTPIKSFGALCKKRKLGNINGRTIFDYFIQHEIIRARDCYYKGHQGTEYLVGRKYQHKTLYVNGGKISGISTNDIVGKYFVEIERIFDYSDQDGQRKTIYLTEEGKEFFLQYVKDNSTSEIEQLSLF